MDGTRFRFNFKRNTAERWNRQNNSGGWQHPIHIAVRPARTSRCSRTSRVELFMRFGDMKGGYPVHCHNTVHEDHQMMLIFNIDDAGDNNPKP